MRRAEGKGSDREHLHMVHKSVGKGEFMRDESAKARENQHSKAFKGLLPYQGARIWVESHRRTINREQHDQKGSLWLQCRVWIEGGKTNK